MRKAWVITLQEKEPGSASKIVDVLNARKKISQVDEHLERLYRSLFPNMVIDADLNITHPTGTEAIMDTLYHTLSAALSEIDEKIYDAFQ